MPLISEIRSTLSRFVRNVRYYWPLPDAPGATPAGVGREEATSEGDDDWKEVWDARAQSLAQSLGSGHDDVYHA